MSPKKTPLARMDEFFWGFWQVFGGFFVGFCLFCLTFLNNFLGDLANKNEKHESRLWNFGP